MTLLTRVRAHLWVTPAQLSTSARKTRVLIRERTDRLEALMATAFESLTESLAGIRGDIAALKEAAAVLVAQVATLTEGQDAAVAAGVEAALADFNAQADAVAAQFAALDAENPEAPVEPPVV